MSLPFFGATKAAPIAANVSGSSFTAALRNRRKQKDAAKATGLHHSSSAPSQPQRLQSHHSDLLISTDPESHSLLRPTQSFQSLHRPSSASMATVGVAAAAAAAATGGVSYGSFATRLSRAASAATAGALGAVSTPAMTAAPTASTAATRATTLLDTVSEVRECISSLLTDC